MTDKNKRVFVLGVGAQKTGTSWLHAYISNDKRANMGFQKEYHIWDAVHSDLCKEFRIPHKEAEGLNVSQYLRYCMQNIDGFYEGYFRSVLNGGAEITGDITPSYSVLDAEQLFELREKIIGIDAKIKVVFLMRDPVERCWSAVRMMKRQSPSQEDDEAWLRKHYASERFIFRTKYEVTCENLKQVFDKSELYFGFYENMFEDENIARISNFLTIDPKTGLKSKSVNVSPKSGEISPELQAEVRDFYADTYDYCFAQFPEIRPFWLS
ncbi:sulfotransferase domain-containing protein [Lutimaribacter sp. EGI FJ00015]|uniref:Sulfotransferase domain-containing protein n=1 Tax=Lutimaribacter degradans TaxID=2945989 RepID=A0ACC5ZVY6_9RHOB|nr:sulfotransferase domain-containing protein [Lutimaribacter sp. EGI FJ00013]MCM2562216.1 sulfotransferase domain-containing protein [Lutimaribacter sp. EGI FJ00013]MCO0613371.1 sulfotransferase domain-containing protein [Lutimaribacter sp. EGI FJ00015]MCO0636345.1 sulfotransferase domain-containing protein [Lutimaribacter sp. EGI FJ00014]